MSSNVSHEIFGTHLGFFMLQSFILQTDRDLQFKTLDFGWFRLFQAQTFLPVSELDLGFLLIEGSFKLPKRAFIHFVLFHYCLHQKVSNKCAIFRLLDVQHLVWYEIQSHSEHLVPMVIQVVICTHTHTHLIFLKTGFEWTSRAPRSKRLARKCGKYAPVYLFSHLCPDFFI